MPGVQARESSDHPDRTVWRFDGCELDRCRRELRRDGVAIAIEPRTYELLDYLIEHRDRALGKDELLAAVWPGQVVTDAAFSQAIMKARRAVADDGQRQQVIRTVHGFGYRFVAEVEGRKVPALDSGTTPVALETPAAAAADSVGLVSAPAPQALAPTPAPVPAPTPPGARLPMLVAALLAVIAGALLWLAAKPAAPLERPIIALLPSPEESSLTEPLVDGLNALIARDLRQQAGVEVISADRVRRLLASHGTAPDASDAQILAALADSTGARYLLRTHIDHDRDGYQSRARLTGRDGRSGELEAERGSILAMVTGLGRELSEQVGSRWQEGLPSSMLSQDDFVNEAYARGLHALLSGDAHAAARLFESALREDPGLDWARYELGNALLEIGERDQGTALVTAVLARAKATGDLRLAGAASTVLGVAAWRAGDLAQAESFLRAALEHYEGAGGGQHGAASALGNLGILAENRGDFAEATELYGRALQRFREAHDAIGESATYTNLAILAQLFGRLHEARDLQLRAIAIQRRLGIGQMLGVSLTTLAGIELELGQTDIADSLLAEAGLLADDLNNRIAKAQVELGLSALALARSRPLSARHHARTALSVFQDVGQPASELQALALLAEAELMAGDTAAAGTHLAAAEAIDTGVDKPRSRGERLLLQSRLALAEGALDQATRLATALVEDTDTRLAAGAEAIFAEADWLAGAHERAQERWRTALALLDRVDEPAVRARIQIRFAQALLDGGGVGIGQAETLVTAAEEWNSEDLNLQILRLRLLEASGRQDRAQPLRAALLDALEGPDGEHLMPLLAGAGQPPAAAGH